MFLKSVHAKGHEYVLLVENYREAGRHRQKVIRYFGRRDRLDMEAVVRFVQRLRAGFAVPHGRIGARESVQLIAPA